MQIVLTMYKEIENAVYILENAYQVRSRRSHHFIHINNRQDKTALYLYQRFEIQQILL